MDRVKLHPNERLGLPDAEAGIGGELALDDQLRRTRTMWGGHDALSESTGDGGKIFEGFDTPTATGGTSLTLNRGSGILPLLDGSTLKYGLMFGDEGVSSYLLDFSAAANGTYNVFVRGVYSGATQQNRVFWNATTGAEQVDNVQTRDVAAWEATFQASAVAPPGNGEWVHVLSVTKAGGVITVITDVRNLFYEGEVSGSYGKTWGSVSTDRSTDRATYGVQDQFNWTQAVRTQLDEIIGKGGWYKKVGTSLNNAGYFVTVDVPGGPGGDGTYATLAAAVTALNATNGGTIILRAGTYDLTADISISKCIRIVGVEGGVILSINNNTANHQLTFAAGADGSCLINVTMAEGANSSENAISVADTVKRFQLLGCDITGTVTLAADVVIDHCTLTGAATNVNTGFVLNFTGASADVNCHIRNTRVLVGSDVGKAETIFVSQGGSYLFENCRVTGNESAADAPGIFGCSGGGSVKMTARNCDFVCAPFGARAAMDLVGEMFFDNCRWTIKAAVADRFNAPVISLTYSAVFRGCIFDFGDYLCDGAAEADAPMYIAPMVGKVSFEHCRFTNMALTNVATNPNVDHFFNINPSAGALVNFFGCQWDGLDMQGSGDIDMHLLGQSGGGAGSGRLQLKGCDFDGSGKTFRTASDSGCMLELSGSISNVKVLGCHFEGGTWNNVIELGNQGVVFMGNTLDFSQAVTPDIEGPFVYLFGTAAEGNDGYCIFVGNSILHESTIAGDYAVRIQGFERVTIGDNTQMNIGSALTYGIYGADTISQGTMFGNNCDDGAQWGSDTGKVPTNANLGTHNRLT